MNNIISGVKKQSGIYQIRNIVNNKVYVGQSKNMSNRRAQHRRELIDGKHYNLYLQRAFEKYGESSFVFEVLEYCEEETLNERERYWISEKESEYKDKGYNAAYAYTLFNRYDKNRKINRSKREPNRFEYTEEIKRKFQKSISVYWDDENNHVRQSLAKSTLDLETIMNIKALLANDLDLSIEEIARRYDVSVNSVAHIRSLASHKYINKEYNFMIKNRYAISERRKDKTSLKMYRDGCTYQEIGNVINTHLRNVIKRIKRIKTKHDDRCRLNVINKSLRKKASLSKTLSNMGYNSVRIAKMLKVSRNYVMDVRKGNQPRLYTDVNQTSGKAKLCEYKKNRASLL